MRYVADFCVAALIGLSCAALAFMPLACMDSPPSTDAGADPDISACCDWYYMPWRADPQTCLEEHTEYGECRWLTCLGGIVTYRACK